MTNDSSVISWHLVAQNLPFALEDTRCANRYFQRWWRDKNRQDKQAIDLWVYCYVCRYFLIKAVFNDISNPMEADHLMGKTFLKVQGNLQTLHAPDRFTHWVSTICKNTFINYARRRPQFISLQDQSLPPVPRPRRYRHDREITYAVLANAIQRLPRFLRPTARLRLLRSLSYQHISEITNKSVPTLRAYMHKALKKIQVDPQVQALHEELMD